MISKSRVAVILAILAVVATACDRSENLSDTKSPNVAPDFTSPRAAAKTFTTALARGDAAVARSAIVDAEKYGTMIDALAGLATSMKKLDAAATAKFGSAGKSLADSGQLMNLGGEIDKSPEKIEGDIATISSMSTTDQRPLRLKRIGADWKLDLAATDVDGKMTQITPLYAAVARGTDEVAADVAAGKFRSVEEARLALQKKMTEAMLGKPGEPTTVPSK